MGAANTSEVTLQEIFQIEPQDDGTWIFKTNKDKFLESKDGGLCSGDPDCTKNEPTDANKFTMEFLAYNKVALAGSSGKYVRQKMNKYIDVQGSGSLECNKAEPQYFAMSQTESGYEIDKWTSSDNLINGNGGGGESYHIELLRESKMAIKFNGKYLQGKQTGEVTFSGSSINKDSTWEY